MTDAPFPSPADAQAAYWNSPTAQAWAEQHERQDRALASLATVALDLAAPQPGEHVLDIGCGSGTRSWSWRRASGRTVMCLVPTLPSTP